MTFGVLLATSSGGVIELAAGEAGVDGVGEGVIEDETVGGGLCESLPPPNKPPRNPPLFWELDDACGESDDCESELPVRASKRPRLPFKSCASKAS